MPRLEHKHEPVESLRRRYSEAIREYTNCESIHLGVGIRPGEQRKNVFDFEDGLRLIISHDDAGHRGKFLHMSASVEPGSKLHRRIEKGRVDFVGFLNRAEAAFMDISDEQAPPEFKGFTSPRGIPHWFREIEGRDGR